MLMLHGRSVQSKTILPGPQTSPTIMVFSGVNQSRNSGTSSVAQVITDAALSEMCP